MLRDEALSSILSIHNPEVYTPLVATIQLKVDDCSFG